MQVPYRAEIFCLDPLRHATANYEADGQTWSMISNNPRQQSYYEQDRPKSLTSPGVLGGKVLVRLGQAKWPHSLADRRLRRVVGIECEDDSRGCWQLHSIRSSGKFNSRVFS